MTLFWFEPCPLQALLRDIMLGCEISWLVATREVMLLVSPRRGNCVFQQGGECRIAEIKAVLISLKLQCGDQAKGLRVSLESQEVILKVFGDLRATLKDVGF